jgi:HTH-type transcriptional regulator / antitoxin HipB
MQDDLERYINARKQSDPEFRDGFEEGYEQFKIGQILRQARKTAGLTQEQLARQMQTKRSAISRIENNSKDVRLSTLEKYVHALGKRLSIQVF